MPIAFLCLVFRSGTVTPVPPLSVADLTLTESSNVKIAVIPEEDAGSWKGDLLVLLAYQQVHRFRDFCEMSSSNSLLIFFTAAAFSSSSPGVSG